MRPFILTIFTAPILFTILTSHAHSAERTYSYPATIHAAVEKIAAKLSKPEPTTDPTTGIVRPKSPLVPAIITAADYRATATAYPHRRAYAGSVETLAPYHFGNRLGVIGISSLTKSLSVQERNGTLHFHTTCNLHLLWRRILVDNNHPRLTFLGRAIVKPIISRVHVLADHIGEQTILTTEQLLIQKFLYELELEDK